MSYQITAELEQNSVDRAFRLLAGIPGGALKAVNAAANRAASSGEALASKTIRGEYLLNAADFKKYTKSTRKIVSQGGETVVNIEFKGVHVPLIRFDTKFGNDGRVTVRVKRASTKTVLEHVFTATMKSGHTGLFERVTDKRFPIEEKMGPSTPQMMDYNDDISQEIGDKIRDTFDERLEHEILAVLNGWRQK